MIIIILASVLCCFGQVARQRNMIYVLDCTASMNGHAGTPKIWDETKNYLKNELFKAVNEDPNVKIVVIPFQDKVLPPIYINVDDIKWDSVNTILDEHIKRITRTNICDAWREGEKYIDQSCDNYMTLMTDGQDNMGANEQARRDLLEKIINEFCSKYKNTLGMYVQLTENANIHPQIRNAINKCENIIIGGSIDGGFFLSNEIEVNTRELPLEIELGFSRYGEYKLNSINTTNPYVNLSVKGNKISKGKGVLCIESKFGDNVEALNKALDGNLGEVVFEIKSNSVVIVNPKMQLILNAVPLRTFDINECAETVSLERVKPFMCIKGNVNDTIKWILSPKFNEAAIKDNAFVNYQVDVDSVANCGKLFYDGTEIVNRADVIISPDSYGRLELVVPQEMEDRTINLTLTQISSHNVDRINGKRQECHTIELVGEINTSRSILEILVWILCVVFIVFLIIWFVFLRNRIYPKFKRGIITIQSPCFAMIRVKGVRKVVFTPEKKSQSWVDKLWKGRVLYHINSMWSCDVEITPSGNNMRFKCPSGRIVSQPSPLWQHMVDYELLNTENDSEIIKVNIN